MTQEERDIRRKIKVLEHACSSGNVSKTCRYFGISRETYYCWRRRYQQYGEKGLVNRRPGPRNPPWRTAPEIEKKVLHLRRTYHFGAQRIAWFLQRYHGVEISEGGVRGTLTRHGLQRLPSTVNKRTIMAKQVVKRYQKQVPGHHVQIDVKFLSFSGSIKRYQYTAVDDATRVRALKIYQRHTLANAIKFVDYIQSQFPFRIRMIRTDNGHEFQAQFHWHLKDLGIDHVYIKPHSPRLNGKVERSHRTDEAEFYQLLEYKGDVDLEERLSEWQQYYNLHRPHTAHGGRTPFEVLHEKLKGQTHVPQM